MHLPVQVILLAKGRYELPRALPDDQPSRDHRKAPPPLAAIQLAWPVGVDGRDCRATGLDDEPGVAAAKRGCGVRENTMLRLLRRPCVSDPPPLSELAC